MSTAPDTAAVRAELAELRASLVDATPAPAPTPDQRTNPHPYVPVSTNGSTRWRTCALCGTGANAHIHRAETGHAGALVTVVVLVVMLAQLAIMGAARQTPPTPATLTTCTVVLTDADHASPDAWSDLADTYGPTINGITLGMVSLGDTVVGYSAEEDSIVYATPACAATMPLYVGCDDTPADAYTC